MAIAPCLGSAAPALSFLHFLLLLAYHDTRLLSCRPPTGPHSGSQGPVHCNFHFGGGLRCWYPLHDERRDSASLS
ncbi:hypothetical protein BDN71DRAFT_976235 [Pleurotus eryngii]|uniref:Secreted protein n=1 Tax=Pleurotus eryngii TaxID=5323 RepID=A0A9P5ZXK1_PLEER|nr:hypothetical protein BDN71DRAFT_976235 [Pleurotus eryngii]